MDLFISCEPFSRLPSHLIASLFKVFFLRITLKLQKSRCVISHRYESNFVFARSFSRVNVFVSRFENNKTSFKKPQSSVKTLSFFNSFQRRNSGLNPLIGADTERSISHQALSQRKKRRERKESSKVGLCRGDKIC